MTMAEEVKGFTPEEKAELKNALGELKDSLEKGLKPQIDEVVKKHLQTINEANDAFKKWQGEKDAADKENQKALDEIIIQIKEYNKNGGSKEVKSFQQAMAEEMAKPEHQEGLKSVSKGRPYRVKLNGLIDLSFKAVADMTLGNNLSGDSVATYNNRQAILPAQKTNFRDLVSTVNSDTGLYVTFRETGGEASGTSWIQTEGSAKTQVDYDLTEVKTVNKVVAGFSRFSRQMVRSLPFMQATLPRLLLRDFYKKENRYFYDVIATNATGSSATAETDDVKQIIDWIANQNQADFSASFGVLSFKALANLNKLLYTNGYYQGSGGVVSMPNGSVMIGGTPIVPVSWVPSNDKIFIFDSDYIERVQVEGITIEFFDQDADNVTKNLMTARIECYEELNTMLPSSIIVGDFGNSSTS